MTSLSEKQCKALTQAWLSEQQAIAIYQAEIVVLKRTLFTAGRKQTLKLCEEILVEELEHSTHIAQHFQQDFGLRLQATLSRWAGVGLGLFLSALPTRVSWKIHSWAEREAAKIYANAYLTAPLSDLKTAEEQEIQHAVLFEKALKL